MAVYVQIPLSYRTECIYVRQLGRPAFTRPSAASGDYPITSDFTI